MVPLYGLEISARNMVREGKLLQNGRYSFEKICKSSRIFLQLINAITENEESIEAYDRPP